MYLKLLSVIFFFLMISGLNNGSTVSEPFVTGLNRLKAKPSLSLGAINRQALTLWIISCDSSSGCLIGDL